jgi:hypothetical protein
MRTASAILVTALIVALTFSPSHAYPKKRGGMPPGLAKKHDVPPGLAKKDGLPPGIAKKYKVGQTIAAGEYLLIEARYRDRLPYGSPEGKEWVRVGRDLYLLGASTGVIVDVIENWLD